MRKVMVKISHCTCSSRYSRHRRCRLFPPTPTTTGGDVCAFHLPASVSLNNRSCQSWDPTCLVHGMCQLDHFKGMIDTEGGGLSLPLGSRPGRTTMPGPFLPLHRGHLRTNPGEREKRNERKILLQPWIQPPLKLATPALPSSESQAIPLFAAMYLSLQTNEL